MRDMQTVNSEMAAVQLSTAAGTEENTENNMDENSKLELDTEAVYHKTGVRSSLTDVNDISVFTDEFEERVSLSEQRRNQTDSLRKEQIFGKADFTVEEEDVRTEMFLNEERGEILRMEQEPSAVMGRSTIAGVIVLLMICIAGICITFRRKGNSKDDNNH